MVLTGNEIVSELNKSIFIEPYNEKSINPNSYDLELDNRIFKYKSDVLDINGDNDFEIIDITEQGFMLEKDSFYFGFSKETICSNKHVPILHNKSGLARMGLFTHITSDLLNLEFKGKVLLQLYPTVNIIIYPNMKIGQLSFWKTQGEI